MAGSSLLALLDDIASILDDVAVMSKAAAKKTAGVIDDVAAMSKIAAKKTAGVLGDDLALNANQVAGVHTDRELPVVWAVAKGSLVNKAILVPAALAISALIPSAITPLLMLGGAYLCYEGFEKVAHKFLHDADDDAHHAKHLEALVDPAIDLVAVEKEKIKGAVRTDFILSAEIIVISLGTVAQAAFGTQVAVLITIALIMTVGVYGLVAAIVKLDDAGLHLNQKTGNGAWPAMQRGVGSLLIHLSPYLMKGLSIAGTIAMFMVGGGILTHGIPPLHHWIEKVAHGGLLGAILPTLLDILVGLIAGAIVLGIVTLGKKIIAPAGQRS